jgi:hypothetical protein
MGSLQPWDHDSDVEIQIIREGKSTGACDVQSKGNQCYDVFREFHAQMRKKYMNKRGYADILYDASRGSYVVYHPSSQESFPKQPSWYEICKRDTYGVLLESWADCFAKLQEAGTYPGRTLQYDLAFSLTTAFPRKEKMLINGHIFRGEKGGERHGGRRGGGGGGKSRGQHCQKRHAQTIVSLQ